jgi:hypothetical protein
MSQLTPSIHQEHEYKALQLYAIFIYLYCGIFAESQGTLLGNGTTNASPQQRLRHSTMKQLREAVFSMQFDASRTVVLQ